MHRLVRAVSLDHLSEAVELLAGLFPSQGDQPTWWPLCAQLLTHIQVLLDSARATQLTDRQWLIC